MKVYEALAKAVVAEDVETIFAVMDDINMLPVVELGENYGVKVIHARHEQGAVLMADGYARVTGKLGVCSIGAGPAIAQTGNGLNTASLHRSPVLVIAADTPTVDRHNRKKFDSRAYAQITGVAFFPVRSSETLAEDIWLAFRHVRSGAGPAVLNITGDVMLDEVDEDWEYQKSSVGVVQPQKVEPEPELVARAAKMLMEASRPMIIAGLGAVISDARQQIQLLSEHVGALIATSVQAHSYFGDHPFYTGTAGIYSTDVAQEFMGEVDCVLGVGASLNAFTTKHGLLFPQAKVIQIDMGRQNIGDVVPVEIGIVADARSTVAAINTYLQKNGVPKKTGLCTKEVKERIAKARAPLKEDQYVKSDGVLDPRQVVAVLNEQIPNNRTVVTEGGYFEAFVILGMSVPAPDAFVFANDMAAIGVALPMSVGVAVGRDDRHCVLFVGDGGFMMTLPELETAARYGISMTIVVMNDEAYGAEVHNLEGVGMPTAMARFRNPEFESVAQALGCKGITVRTPEDLDRAAKQVGKTDGPLLIDVKMNGDVLW